MQGYRVNEVRPGLAALAARQGFQKVRRQKLSIFFFLTICISWAILAVGIPGNGYEFSSTETS
jgi:nitrate reductase NapE component